MVKKLAFCFFFIFAFHNVGLAQDCDTLYQRANTAFRNAPLDTLLIQNLVLPKLATYRIRDGNNLVIVIGQYHLYYLHKVNMNKYRNYYYLL